MPRKKHIEGICHICGEHTKLSFEHVPPRSAFNNRPVVQANIDELLKGEVKNLDSIPGKLSNVVREDTLYVRDVTIELVDGMVQLL